MEFIDEVVEKELSWHGISVVIDSDIVRPFPPQISSMTLSGAGTITYGGKVCQFYFDEKKVLSHNSVNRLIDINKHLNMPLCIISDQLSSNLRRSLKESRISYITQNHIYSIICSDFLIYIDPYVKFPRIKSYGIKKLTKSQLAFLFVFLVDQSLINKTNKEISQHIEMSEGAVSNAINFLAKEQFISKSGNKRSVNNIPEIFEKLTKDLEKFSEKRATKKEISEFSQKIQDAWTKFKKEKTT